MIENKKENEELLDKIIFKIPSKAQYVKLARLTTSGVCSNMGFDIEAIDDIKVAVAEACTNVIEHSFCKSIEIIFELYINKIKIIVMDKGIGFDVKNIEKPDLLNPKEGGLGLFIIKSLMDEVDFKSYNNDGSEICMIKYLGDDILW